MNGDTTCANTQNLQGKLNGLRELADRLGKAAYGVERLTDKLCSPIPADKCCGESCPQPTPRSLDESLDPLARYLTDSITRIEIALSRAHGYVGNFVPDTPSEICNTPLQKVTFR